MMYIISETMETDENIKIIAPVGMTFARQDDAQAVLKMMIQNGADGVSDAFDILEIPDVYEEGVSPSLDEIAEDILYQTDYDQ